MLVSSSLICNNELNKINEKGSKHLSNKHFNCLTICYVKKGNELSSHKSYYNFWMLCHVK